MVLKLLSPIRHRCRAARLLCGIALAATALGAAAQAPAPVRDDAVAAPATAACAQDAQWHAAVRALAAELQPLGLALHLRCDSGSGGWAAQLRVRDGLRAVRTVRGPLADGGWVDMGTPAGEAGARAGGAGQDFSPDVQHNRRWFSALMQRRGFAPQADAWWHFAWRPADDRALLADAR